MSITLELRAMLDQRARRVKAIGRAQAIEQLHQRNIHQIFEIIDKAAPFMDEQWGGRGWKPSELVKFGFWTASTSGRDGSVRRAVEFVNSMLGISRERWITGMDPNPFLGRPFAEDALSHTSSSGGI